MAENEVSEICRNRFDKIEERLEAGNEKFEKHSVELAENRIDIGHLAKGLKGLTMALWAVALAILTALLTLVVFVVEKLII
jgi:hypothetical protein